MLTTTRSLLALAAMLLACGKLADDDAGSDADAANVDASSSTSSQQTCSVGPGGGVVDASPGTPKTITCPVRWHCDYNAAGGGASASVCCPAGHTDHPKSDPACAYCQCINTCCPAGFSCASWDAAPPICDGG